METQNQKPIDTVIAFTQYSKKTTKCPIITIKNNGIDLNFLVDTGSDYSHIDKDIIDKLQIIDNIVFEMPLATNTIGGWVEHENRHIIVDLGINEFNFRCILQVDALMDSLKESYREKGIELNGILGCNFLNDNIADIDFYHQNITFAYIKENNQYTFSDLMKK